MKKIVILFELSLLLSLIGIIIILEMTRDVKSVVTKNEVELLASSYGVIDKKYNNYITYIEDKEEQVEYQTAQKEIDIEHLNKHLEKYNSDYIGSINIPAINVSDSVYKSEGDYYLDKDYNKKNNELGEIYLDERTGESIIGNGALLNGHAVKNGQKFGNFKDLLELEEAPEIFIYDHEIGKTLKYKVMFVSLIDGSNSGIIMEFETGKSRLKYYNRMYDTAIKKWEKPIEGNKFLLLNSCSYIIKDGRYVVFAQEEE